MIELYQKYIEDKLKEAGIKTLIHKTMKSLQDYKEPHVGAVIVDSDKLSLEKQSKVYEVGEQKIKRVKKFSRTTQLNVIIGEYKVAKCDEIFTVFLSLLDAGIYDLDGNYIAIELEDAAWVSDKDNILKSSIAVQVPVRFVGGIYADYQYKTITPHVLLAESEENDNG